MEEAAAVEEADAEELSRVIGSTTGDMASAGLKGVVVGENPFEVQSDNIQMGASVEQNPNGFFTSPRAPDGTESPTFEIPRDSNVTTADEQVEVVAMTNRQNPYDGIRGQNSQGEQTNLQGSVATFELRDRAGGIKDVKIDNFAGATPIRFKIPLQLSASSCRRD